MNTPPTTLELANAAAKYAEESAECAERAKAGK